MRRCVCILETVKDNSDWIEFVFGNSEELNFLYLPQYFIVDPKINISLSTSIEFINEVNDIWK